MSLSFRGYNENFLTFKAASGLEAGQLVKMSDNETVTACTEGDPFMGLAVSVKNGYATVQMSGYAIFSYVSMTAPALGTNIFSSDATGRKLSTMSYSGVPGLVVHVNSADSTVGVIF